MTVMTAQHHNVIYLPCMLILEGRSFKLHQEVGQILRKLLGDDKLNEMFIPRYTPHIIGEYSQQFRSYIF